MGTKKESMQISLWGELRGYTKLKDRSFKLTIETPELNAEQVLGIDYLFQKAVYVIIGLNPIEFDREQIAQAIETDPKEWKLTKSQRLRNTLYRYREAFEKKNYPSFLDYYDMAMEGIIKKLQDKLP